MSAEPYVETTCPTSKRVDDATLHSTRFDGDNPYTICVYCGEMRDAISGRIIRAASQPEPSYGTVAGTDENAPSEREG